MGVLSEDLGLKGLLFRECLMAHVLFSKDRVWDFV